MQLTRLISGILLTFFAIVSLSGCSNKGSDTPNTWQPIQMTGKYVTGIGGKALPEPFVFPAGVSLKGSRAFILALEPGKPDRFGEYAFAFGMDQMPALQQWLRALPANNPIAGSTQLARLSRDHADPPWTHHERLQRPGYYATINVLEIPEKLQAAPDQSQYIQDYVTAFNGDNSPVADGSPYILFEVFYNHYREGAGPQ